MPDQGRPRADRPDASDGGPRRLPTPVPAPAPAAKRAEFVDSDSDRHDKRKAMLSPQSVPYAVRDAQEALSASVTDLYMLPAEMQAESASEFGAGQLEFLRAGLASGACWSQSMAKLMS